MDKYDLKKLKFLTFSKRHNNFANKNDPIIVESYISSYISV